MSLLFKLLQRFPTPLRKGSKLLGWPWSHFSCLTSPHFSGPLSVVYSISLWCPFPRLLSSFTSWVYIHSSGCRFIVPSWGKLVLATQPTLLLEQLSILYVFLTIMYFSFTPLIKVVIYIYLYDDLINVCLPIYTMNSIGIGSCHLLFFLYCITRT